MRVTRLLSVLLLSLPGLAAAAEAPADPSSAKPGELRDLRELRDVPAFLPRAVFFGSMFEKGAVTPQVRVQWEWRLLDHGDDMLAIAVEGGGGYALAHPSGLGVDGDARMTFLYQHTALVGLVYRGRRGERFRWGADLLTGPHWYGARYDGLRTENRLNGLLEGRARVGWNLGPLTLGVAVGYASPYSRPFLSNAAPFVGGFTAGLFLDWWH